MVALTDYSPILFPTSVRHMVGLQGRLRGTIKARVIGKPRARASCKHKVEERGMAKGRPAMGIRSLR